MRPVLIIAVLVLVACGDDEGVGARDAEPTTDAGAMDGASDGATPDAAAPPPTPQPPRDAGPSEDAAPDDRLAWPNDESRATSDPWIVENHARIEVLRPRILGLSFRNGRTIDDMRALFASIFAAMREGSRRHGHRDARARPMLEPELAYAVDLTDRVAPDGWPYRNSTLYPREDPVEGTWGFDYEALFSASFAERYGIEDPDAPGRALTLCELSERGLVHEVWVYADADVPDVAAAEILTIQPVYDESGARLPGELARCAGNGCFDVDDEIPADCTRTLRIGWVNNTRGVGCYLESYAHGIERMGNGGHLPPLSAYWRDLAGFDLDDRYGLPFDSWYVCGGLPGHCLTYTSESSVTYATVPASGSIDPYVPTCGNAHFPPNARDPYDLDNEAPVLSTCETWRDGDVPMPVGRADWDRYRALAPDCTGAWLVWWWQHFPAHDDPTGAPATWPFLYW